MRTEGKTVLVDTGVLRARLGGAGSGFIRSLAYDANGDGKYAANESVVDEARPGTLRCGEFSSAFGEPDRVAVEEAGPVRVVVRLAGHHQAPAGARSLAYDVRLTFTAGSPLLRVDHTFLQDTDQIFADIPSISLDLPLSLERAGVTFAGEGEKAVTVSAGADQRVGLLQLGPDQKEVIVGQESEEFRKILAERKPYWSPEEEARWTKGPERTEWSATVSGPAGKQAVPRRAARRAVSLKQIPPPPTSPTRRFRVWD